MSIIPLTLLVGENPVMGLTVRWLKELVERVADILKAEFDRGFKLINS